jgi:hypothetical protein
MPIPTSPSLVAAAILTVLVGILHSWLGERRLIGPLLAPGQRSPLLDRSAFHRSVLRFAWHLTTVTWFAFAAVLLVLAAVPALAATDRLVLAIIAILFGGSGAFTSIMSRGRHISWPFFLAIGVLSAIPLLSA